MTTKPRISGDIETKIGLRMRAIRTDKGVSQDSLARQLGMSFQQIQKYEKGTNRISLSRAVQIAQLLGTSVDELTSVNGFAVGDAVFDVQAYKLSQSLRRLQELSPVMARRFRSLIDSICDDIEAATKPRRGRG